ncbi:hypothetical protein NW753_013535 [Fusarium oxysporum]|nr:hypothetical protein NW758_013138 [Fusarium oxysporum]KAJ4031304.1 hypothetical protein NW753_013535 [Fusarium oxysporum]KAJ4081273.1 hypothetical protein NW769_014902 [Fusarium oxysporum]
MVYLRMLRFQLLTIALLANTFYVQARRGGGGGGDYDGGSSGGGGSSDGDSGGSGPSPEEKARSDPCRMEAGHTSPVWLHRWIGTYYNGTVEISVELDRCNGTCKKSESKANWELTGVLAILDPMHAAAGNSRPYIPRPKNPFIGVLYGWSKDTNQSELLAKRDDTFLPPPVNLAMETVSDFHYNEFMYGLDPSDTVSRSNPTCRVQDVTSTDDGYEFDCAYDGLGVYRATDSSQFTAPIHNSNGSNPLVVEPANNTLLSGSFDPRSAEFQWRGPFHAFAGSFGQDSMRKSYTPERNYITGDEAAYTGNFTVRFIGTVDLEHSHEMVVKSGRDVSWDKDEEKVKNITYCSAASGKFYYRLWELSLFISLLLIV